MNHADLIFAIESAMNTNGLESVLRLLADTVSERADIMSGDMGFGLYANHYGMNPESGEDWNRAADLIRDVAESLPDSTR